MSTKDDMSNIGKSTSKSGSDLHADNMGFMQDVWQSTTIQIGLIAIVTLAATLGWYAFYSYEHDSCEHEFVRIKKLEDRIQRENRPFDAPRIDERLENFCKSETPDALFQNLLLWLALYLPFAGVFYFFVTRRLTTFFYFVGAAGFILGLHYLFVPRIGPLG